MNVLVMGGAGFIGPRVIRRLVERGVRFIQLYHGAGSRWDAHSNIESNHTQLCKAMDKPVAGLLQDLKQRGMLEDTIVIFGGEFVRGQHLPNHLCIALVAELGDFV